MGQLLEPQNQCESRSYNTHSAERVELSTARGMEEVKLRHLEKCREDEERQVSLSLLTPLALAEVTLRDLEEC